MNLFLYNLLLLFLMPFMVFRILVKSLKDSDYRLNFLNRFGVYKYKKLTKKSVWFHAVSLGEVISSKKIVENILDEHDVVLTVSTPTGLREAKSLYGSRLEVVYAPWDLSIFVSGFFKTFKPSALILFETEIWPSMISNAHQKKIPIIIANGRMSEKSFKGYMRFNFLLRNTMSKLSKVFAQSEAHKDRFNKLGISLEKIEVVGSTKFDTNIYLKKSKDNFFERKIILAASTHKKEDEIIIAAYKTLINQDSNIKLIIAPRHPERAGAIKKNLNKMNIHSTIYKSIPKDFDIQEVIIISATGLLSELYDLASVAFIGGSLFKEYGGHNFIEAAAHRCPFVVGPFMQNFEDILDLFTKKNACIQVSKNEDVFNTFNTLLNDMKLRDDMVNRALRVCEENSGSTEKQYKSILDIIRGEEN